MLTNAMNGEQHFFQCLSCPYMYPITTVLSERTAMTRKEVDDVLGGAKAWENVDKTEQRCPKCEHPEAYFREVQIRSADEPSTQFFRCCNLACTFEWRVG
ncbi:RNA polymerase III C11 subunit [Dispira simplex]|nr:RNA polymerase III C11 subunit [Dispira simplex]